MRNRFRLALGLMLLPLLSACNQAGTQLERVLERGELRIITRNAATTYYEGPEGPRGMEYELARGFADALGVRLSVVTATNATGVLHGLQRGKADLAAAGLSITDARQANLRFTPPYQTVTQQVVYRAGAPRPKNASELTGRLEVVSDSSHVDRLRLLQAQHPELSWAENGNVDSEELLTLVWEKVLDYTIADSNEVVLTRRFYPELKVAFELAEPKSLAWAFRRDHDDSLYQAAVAYFEEIRADGTLDQLLERHYGHLEEFDFVGARLFQAHVQQRLPAYLPLFQKVAASNALDWRLLAAMGYQESHWNPHAVSPTGVRGLMQLTRVTARDLGIAERTDPVQSIEGAGRYLRGLIDRVPERIPYPDRLWFAVAAYNVGYGHLEDARILTEMRGGNPDRWMDVKNSLPLLSKQAWYKKTRYGYARGHEPVKYVENIRSYYEVLAWTTGQIRTASNDADASWRSSVALAWPL
ncbi:MAG: membrane-bound lytic murein transglycosylase MltF [Gammaproteobacteria bacterium]|nr:membrane-bound lytic murein transglycosylase MltF [Gammaproteobacteria bacterium]